MPRFPGKCLAVLAVFPLLAGVTASQAATGCGADLLMGTYVLTGTGSTRSVTATPGTPWTPKAIVEVIKFNGDGSLTTPAVTVANPFGDTGGILQPPTGGAPGAYIVNDDCTGRVHFFDTNGTMYSIYVEPPKGDSVWMIQTNPLNNVFQGVAKRVP
jgi:hypothetical protein